MAIDNEPVIQRLLFILKNSDTRQNLIKTVLNTIKTKRINSHVLVNSLNDNLFIVLDKDKDYVIEYIDTYLPKYLKIISKLLEAYLNKKVNKDEFLFKVLPHFFSEFKGVYKMENSKLQDQVKEQGVVKGVVKSGFSIDAKKNIDAKNVKPLNESLIEIIEFLHSQSEVISSVINGLKNAVPYLKDKKYSTAGTIVMDALNDSGIKNKRFIALCKLGLSAVDLLGNK
nr:MAG TPA: hypothetical protein [Caudoviricetes sp.]